MDIATDRVLRAEEGDIGRLVRQLEHHGPLSAKARCVLLLLKNGVNKFPYKIFYSGCSEDLVVLIITRPSADFSCVTVFAREELDSQTRLAAVLRAPVLRASLWGCEFRADGWPVYLAPVLRAAADQLGFSWLPVDTTVTFARPAGLPEAGSPSRPGVSVRPLRQEHLKTVKNVWPHTEYTTDVDPMIGDGLAAGLSAGAFVTDAASTSSEEAATADGLSSWVVVNHNGGLGFLHTLESQRRRGLARAVLAELTRTCEARGYPSLLHSDHAAVIQTAHQLGYVTVCPVTWVVVSPPNGPPTDGQQ